jgi:Flp pilus assembly protein TadG
MLGFPESETANRPSHLRASRRRGHAIVETTLIAPWIFFLFVGLLDFGFYAYGLISVQNAARVAALTAGTSSGAAINQARACHVARDELQWMPNLRNLAPTYDCSASPLKVDINTDPNYMDADGSPATWVRVTYDTIQLIPIPGLVMGKTTISRRVEMRIYGG